MIIDAWSQHPSAEFLTDPMSDSLRRWSHGQLAGAEVPVEATVAAMDAAGVRIGLLCAWWGPQGPLISNDTVAAIVGSHPDGSPLWRFAPGEHCGHQVQQRPGEVVLGDHDIPVIHVQVVDSAPRSRPVRQRDRQGTCGQFLPLEGVAAASGVDDPALDGAVRSDLGHYDPHKPSLRPRMPGKRPWVPGPRPGP